MSFAPSGLGLDRWRAESITGSVSDGGLAEAIANDYATGDEVTQPDDAMKPVLTYGALNGLAALTLDGARSMTLPTRTFGVGDFTAVFVVAGALNTLVGHSSGYGGIVGAFGGAAQIMVSDNTTAVQPIFITTPRARTSWRILTFVRRDGALTGYVNGMPIGRFAFAANLTLDRLFNGTQGSGLTAQVAEVMFGAVGLTESQRHDLHAFLGNLYSLPVNDGSGEWNIACVGDSQTFGYQVPVGYAWPYQLSRLTDNTSQVWNRGINGHVWADLASEAADIDALIVDGKINVLVVWCGTNDLYGDASAAAVIAASQSYITDRQAVWDVVYLIPIMSRSDGSTPVAYNARRATVNTAYGSIGEGVITLPTELISDGVESSATHFAGDNCHLSFIGDGIVAARVYQHITGDSGSIASGGLQLKLISDDAGADGASVSTWGGDVGSTVSNELGESQPVVHANQANGEKGVTFASSVMGEGALSIGTAYTVLAAFADTGAGANKAIFSARAANILEGKSVSGQQMWTVNGNSTSNDGGAYYGAPVLSCARNDGTTFRSLLGGVDPGDISGTTTGFTGTLIGGSISGTDLIHRFSGKLFSLLLWDRALTPAEFAAGRKKLAVKFGLVYAGPEDTQFLQQAEEAAITSVTVSLGSSGLSGGTQLGAGGLSS